MGLIETIHSPADLRRLDQPQLAKLAEEVRAFLVEQTSKTGGHLSPNLGVVELTFALHRVFDTRRTRSSGTPATRPTFTKSSRAASRISPT